MREGTDEQKKEEKKKRKGRTIVDIFRTEILDIYKFPMTSVSQEKGKKRQKHD